VTNSSCASEDGPVGFCARVRNKARWSLRCCRPSLKLYLHCTLRGCNNIVSAVMIMLKDYGGCLAQAKWYTSRQ